MAYPIEMRVVDGSLGRRIPDKGPADFLVPGSFSIMDIAAQIPALAGANPIGKLTLVCHGFGIMAHGDMYRSQSLSLPAGGSKLVCRVYGGYGLELGGEGLDLRNVNDFAALKGSFSSSGIIVVYGCAAADTGPTYNEGGRTFTGDGPALMKALAAATGASVVAAVQLQTVVQNWYLGTVDRGPFLGATYLFTPDGRQTRNLASY